MTISMTPASRNIWRYSFRRILENSLNLERNRFVFMIIVFPSIFLPYRFFSGAGSPSTAAAEKRPDRPDRLPNRLSRSAHALIDEQVHIVGHGKKVSDDPYRQIHGQKGKRQARERERKHRVSSSDRQSQTQIAKQDNDERAYALRGQYEKQPAHEQHGNAAVEPARRRI